MRLSHTRSWKSYLAFCVAQLVFAYPFIFAFVYFFPPSGLIYAVSGFLLIGLTALFGWEIYFSIRYRRDFYCILEEGRIRCSSPSPTTGSSFDLMVSDIVKIEDNDGKVTLTDNHGNEFWLTSNYGNPAGRFVQLIAQCNSSISVEHV